MYRFCSVIFIVVFFSRAHAQFKGMDSFRWDSIWQEKFRQAKVKSVRESKGFNGNTEYYTGYITFDKKGKVLAFALPHAGSYQRFSFVYNKKGQKIKTVQYDSNDTSKIISQEDIKFDRSGNELGKLNTFLYSEKWLEERTEIKTFQKSKNLRIKEETQFRDGKIYTTALQKDSISDSCNFMVRTTREFFQEDTPDESNYISTERSQNAEVNAPANYTFRHITWRCSDKHITYYIRIDSDGNEKTNKIDKVEIHYAKRDAKNRLLEVGDLLNLQSYSSTADLIPKLMHLAATGRERASLKFLYKEDLLVEESIVGDITSYSYNEKGQLIESVKSKPKKEISVYSYNGLGLITKIKNSTLSDDGKTVYTSTTHYSYDYY